MGLSFPTLRQQLGLPEQADRRPRNNSVAEPKHLPTPIEQTLNDLKVIETHMSQVESIGGDEWAIRQQIRRELFEHVDRCYKERERLQYETDKQNLNGMRDLQVRQALKNGFKLSNESRAWLARTMNRVLRYEMENGVTPVEAGEEWGVQKDVLKNVG